MNSKPYPSIVPLLLLCLLPILAFSQHIKRKGKLGVQLAKAEKNVHQAPYKIAQVFPNSTAENMHLQAGDIVIQINDQPFNSGQAIQQIIEQFLEGELVNATVSRNGQVIELKGKVVAYEVPPHSEDAEVLLGEIPFKAGYIRSILNKPKGVGPFKVIYYIQGYPCQSVNYQLPHPSMQFIAQLVDLGYAVYRVEKPGIGEFSNCAPCQDQLFEDEVLAFRNGYRELLKQSAIDPEQIYLFGHSLGGNVAPIVGSEFKPAGIMVYGTLIKPWTEYLVDMARYTQPLFEQDITNTETQIPLLKSALTKLYDKQMSPWQLSADEQKLLADWHDLKDGAFVFNRKIDFWRNFSKANFKAHWNRVQSPVLALYGSSDVHAISSLDAEFITHIVNRNHPGKATFQIVEGANHLFAKVDDKLEEVEYLKEGLSGQIAATRFNATIAPLVDHWVGQLQEKQANERFQLANQLFPQEWTKASTMDVEAADLDLDGDLDLILAAEFGPNQVFFNEDGTFLHDTTKLLPALKSYQAPFLGEDSEDIALADFDQDGDVDLLFVSEDTEHHELLENKGNGQFAFTAYQIPKIGEANAVQIIDFNADQFPDVLIGIRGRNEVYINQGDFTFKNETETFWPKNEDSTQDLQLVDIDGDQDLDLVEGIEAGGSNLYLHDGGKYVEVTTERFPNLEDYETRKVLVGDVDNDQDVDLYFCNVGWSGTKNPQNLLMLNNGKGYFEIAPAALPEEVSTTLDGVFFDFNQDGLLDILTTGLSDTNNLKLYINKSTGSQIQFELDSKLLPKVKYTGGIALKMADFNQNQSLGIYLGNHKQKDHFLLEIGI